MSNSTGPVGPAVWIPGWSWASTNISNLGEYLLARLMLLCAFTAHNRTTHSGIFGSHTIICSIIWTKIWWILLPIPFWYGILPAVIVCLAPMMGATLFDISSQNLPPLFWIIEYPDWTNPVYNDGLWCGDKLHYLDYNPHWVLHQRVPSKLTRVKIRIL